MKKPLSDLTKRWNYIDREVSMLANDFALMPTEKVRAVVDYCLQTFESKNRPTVGRIRMYLADGIPRGKDDTPSAPVTNPGPDRRGPDLSRKETGLFWKFVATLYAAESPEKRGAVVRRFIEASGERGHKWSESTQKVYFALYERYMAQCEPTPERKPAQRRQPQEART